MCGCQCSIELTPSESVHICFGREITDSKPALPSHYTHKETEAQRGDMNEPKYLLFLLPLALASRSIRNLQSQALGRSEAVWAFSLVWDEQTQSVGCLQWLCSLSHSSGWDALLSVARGLVAVILSHPYSCVVEEGTNQNHLGRASKTHAQTLLASPCQKCTQREKEVVVSLGADKYFDCAHPFLTPTVVLPDKGKHLEGGLVLSVCGTSWSVSFTTCVLNGKMKKMALER